MSSGLNESASGFMSDISAKIIELESVKQVRTTPLNSLKTRTNLAVPMHGDS